MCMIQYTSIGAQRDASQRYRRRSLGAIWGWATVVHISISAFLVGLLCVGDCRERTHWSLLVARQWHSMHERGINISHIPGKLTGATSKFLPGNSKVDGTAGILYSGRPSRRLQSACCVSLVGVRGPVPSAILSSPRQYIRGLPPYSTLNKTSREPSCLTFLPCALRTNCRVGQESKVETFVAVTSCNL